jgi:LPS sulfotransferase NodH
MNKPLVTILTIARTGSNYFCELIEKNFTDINVSYELFNNKYCYINDNLYNKISKIYESSGNLHEKIKDNPFDLLINISNTCHENNICFKLFLDHLNSIESNKILMNSSLVIILKRNYLDSYISNEKAIQLKKYSNINTDNIKIHFDINNFNHSKKKYDDLYEIYLKYILENNISYIEINYEDFHKLNLLEQQIFMQKIFDEKIRNNTIKINKNHNSMTFFKQDTSENYKDKIINYTEFVEYFEKSNRS